MKVTVTYDDIKKLVTIKNTISKLATIKNFFFDNPDIQTSYIARLTPKYTSQKASRGAANFTPC